MASEKLAVFWFRRDLRLNDNKALHYALREHVHVLPLFIFDEDIINSLPKDDHRVSFIYDVLEDMHKELMKSGSGLRIERGRPVDVLQKLCRDLPVEAVFCNWDHEPYGRDRDDQVARSLKDQGVAFTQYLDHMVMDMDEVMKKDGNPYHVFTPYSRQWRTILQAKHLQSFDIEKYKAHFADKQYARFPSRKQLQMQASALKAPDAKIDEEVLRRYDKDRDYPARNGTSRLGVHLRFGTVSIRQVVRLGMQWNDTFVNELIWREFYAMIMWHYPQVITRSFKPAYDRIRWQNDEAAFVRWKKGMTGYPMVDAGMRQLEQTGYMHNRLRMLTASFLSKHLLTDWRWGEAWFGEKLFDYELSSNNGGWQWSAGTGCDAAPYFRIFNPETQQKKFDPEGHYLKLFIPELGTGQYPAPMIDHRKARERCLREYRKALDNSK